MLGEQTAPGGKKFSHFFKKEFPEHAAPETELTPWRYHHFPNFYSSNLVTLTAIVLGAN